MFWSGSFIFNIELDDVVAEFGMPKYRIYHPIFVGNCSDALKKLSADHGVRIFIPDSRVPSTGTTISLEGGVESVYTVLTILNEVMTNPDNLYNSAHDKSLLRSDDHLLRRHQANTAESIVEVSWVSVI